MLCELLIKNFAIIDDLNIRFSDGLTILTGETGAGKSIIINAVSLLLGGRATPKMIRTGADTAELEALFQVAAKSLLAQTIADLGYDISDGLLVKRVVSRNERHRIYVNGHIATTQALSAITGHLASISGQFAHQGILKEDQQLLTLDQFGGLLPLREQIFADYHRIIPLIEELRNLESKKLRQSEHIDLLQYQKKEIAEAALFPGEDNTLEMERNRLKNAESLYEKIYSGIESLYGGKGAVVERLVEIKKSMDSASRIDPSLTAKIEGITEATFRIEEVVEHLRNYLNQISVDENRLEAIEARLDLIQKLKRKYGGSIESVLNRLRSIEKELSGIEDLPIEIEKIKRELSIRHASILKAATDISQKRGETAGILSEKVEKELESLKMEKTRFSVLLKKVQAGRDTDPHLAAGVDLIHENGIDRASFMIAPNVGEALKPLAEIASGGELSRVILALKAILAGTESVETIIFDEVDAGIGGGAAEVVGKKLSALARYHQIICITHLPQIAAFGDHHFKISKQIREGRTRTTISAISEKERVQEIARMLGGTEITQTTLKHATEMLNRSA